MTVLAQTTQVAEVVGAIGVDPVARRPRPVSAVTTTETSIIIGNARNMGLRLMADPDRKATAMTPTVMTDMTTGSRRTSAVGDAVPGSSGGASTAMSAAGTAGGSCRGRVGPSHGCKTLSSTGTGGKSPVDSRIPRRSKKRYRAEGPNVVCTRSGTAPRLSSRRHRRRRPGPAGRRARREPDPVDHRHPGRLRRRQVRRSVGHRATGCPAPGVPALRASTTLAQNDIRDGAVLILSQSRADLPAPRYDDVAEAVAATLDADARPWTRRATRLTGAVAAGLFTGVGGLALIRNTLSDNVTRDVDATAGIAAVASSSLPC